MTSRSDVPTKLMNSSVLQHPLITFRENLLTCFFFSRPPYGVFFRGEHKVAESRLRSTPRYYPATQRGLDNMKCGILQFWPVCNTIDLQFANCKYNTSAPHQGRRSPVMRSVSMRWGESAAAPVTHGSVYAEIFLDGLDFGVGCGCRGLIVGCCRHLAADLDIEFDFGLCA